jgi:hypothetical protein
LVTAVAWLDHKPMWDLSGARALDTSTTRG